MFQLLVFKMQERKAELTERLIETGEEAPIEQRVINIRNGQYEATPEEVNEAQAKLDFISQL